MGRVVTRRRLVSCFLLGALVFSPLAARAEPTPAPGGEVDTANAPSRGPDNAPVTMVELADFDCPFCAAASRPVRALVRVYPDQLRGGFKHYAIAPQSGERMAHEAALAAQEQGKFWEMHDLLFANPTARKRDDLLRYAREIDLDMAAFTQALDSRRFRARVVRETAQARRAGIGATPTFLINGKPVVGTRNLGEFRHLVDDELARLGPSKPQPAPTAADR